MTRTCTVCKQEKELNSENFRPHVSRNGFRHQCRICCDKLHIAWGRQLKNLPVIMCQSAKHRAKRDGVEFSIKSSDIVIPEFCPALGTRLEQGTRAEHGNAPTLDRIIPSLGYVKGNIRVISHRANLIKNNATIDELKRMVAYMEGNGLQSSITS